MIDEPTHIINIRRLECLNERLNSFLENGADFMEVTDLRGRIKRMLFCAKIGHNVDPTPLEKYVDYRGKILMPADEKINGENTIKENEQKF